MQGKDQLEQNISNANRQSSAADGGNLLQNAATARMNQMDRQCQDAGPFASAPGDWEASMRDYQVRDQFENHFRLPGGMTFRSGQILPEKK